VVKIYIQPPSKTLYMSIIDAAAMGVPDNRLGELVAAVVTVAPGSKLT
jgi:acyl-CoA synthetase (AMP-forming)/AMP-acid ligase II